MDKQTDRSALWSHKPHFRGVQGLEKKSEQSFLLERTPAKIRMGFQGREISSHRGGGNHQHMTTSNFRGAVPAQDPGLRLRGPWWGLRGRRAEIGALEAARGLREPDAGLSTVRLRATLMFSSPARGEVALAWPGT